MPFEELSLQAWDRLSPNFCSLDGHELPPDSAHFFMPMFGRGVYDQEQQVYRLFLELRPEHPGLDIVVGLRLILAHYAQLANESHVKPPLYTVLGRSDCDWCVGRPVLVPMAN